MIKRLLCILLLLSPAFAQTPWVWTGTHHTTGLSSTGTFVGQNCPNITQGALPHASQGLAYSRVISEAGGTPPFTWSVIGGSLPAGITLALSTGTISGTTSLSGSFPFTAQVTDSSSCSPATANLTLVVDVVGTPFVLPPASLPPATKTGIYSASASATGGTQPYSNCTVTTGTFPSSINLSTGGTTGPNFTSANVSDSAGTYPFTLDCQDAVGVHAQQSYSITVVDNAAFLWSDIYPAGYTPPSTFPNPQEDAIPAVCPSATCLIKYLGPSAGTCPANGGVCDYTTATAQNIVSDWIAAADQFWLIKITAQGASGTNTIVLPMQSNNGAANSKAGLILNAKSGATRYLRFDSDNSALPAGQIVCSHGFTDFGIGLPDEGQRNWKCDGSQLGFGPTTYTSDSSYNDKQYMWHMTVKNNGVSTDQTDCTGKSGAKVIESGLSVGTGGVNHISFHNGEVDLNTCVGPGRPISLDPPDWGVGSPSDIPTHIILDRLFIHGDADETGFGKSKLTAAINFTCNTCSITNSYITHIKYDSTEDHGISMTDATGTLLIDHTWCEGATICIWSGGAVPEIPDSKPVSVLITRVRDTYQLNWCPSPAGQKGGTNKTPVAKNRLEFKAIDSVLIDGSIFENSCVDGQAGQFLQFGSRACSGSGGSPAGACTGGTKLSDSNIGVTNTILRHGNTGGVFGARSGGLTTISASVAAGGAVCNGNGSITVTSTNTGAKSIWDNSEVYITALTGAFSVPAGWYSAGKNTGAATQNIEVITDPLANGITCTLGQTSGTGTIYGNNGSNGGGVNVPNHGSVIQNVLGYDIGNHTLYNGSGASSAWQGGGNGNQFTANMVYHTGTGKATATAVAIDVCPASRSCPLFFGLKNGDLVTITNCTNTNFNTGQFVNSPAPAISNAGTDYLNTSFDYTPWNGAAIANNATTTCTLNNPTQANAGVFNAAGYPADTFFNHVTLLGTNGMKYANLDPGSAGSPIPPLQHNATLKNMLLVSDAFGTGTAHPGTAGGFTGNNKEGYQVDVNSLPNGGINFAWDEGTLDMHHNATSSNNPSSYTFKYNAGVRSANSNCTSDFSGICRPTTVVCSGASATSSCFGFKNLMNGAAYQINDPDFRNYSLDTSSKFYTAGDDGRDIGAVIPTIIQAFSRTHHPLTPYDNPFQAQEDLVDWMLLTDRTNHYMFGTNSEASWKDADGVKFWHIKSHTNGFPWDIRTYTSTRINWWITEQTFGNPATYKRYLTPVPLVPRFLTPGTAFDTGEIPGPNTIQIVDGTAGVCVQSSTANIGHIKGVTTGPTDTIWTLTNVNGGNPITLPTITVNYYWGGTNGSNTYNTRERYSFAKPYGLLQWDTSSWNGSSYTVNSTSTFNIFNNGGAITPQFDCYTQGVAAGWWIGGQPGVGGNIP